MPEAIAKWSEEIIVALGTIASAALIIFGRVAGWFSRGPSNAEIMAKLDVLLMQIEELRKDVESNTTDIKAGNAARGKLAEDLARIEGRCLGRP